MKVSRITIGRLYNLGNYEHVRYELTVEVPEGESAAEAVLGLQKILHGLKPDRTVKCAAELDRAAEKIKHMEALTDPEFNNLYNYSGEQSRETIMQSYRANLENEIKRSRDYDARQSVARSLFDDVGGAAAWKDGKADWQDDEL